MRTPPSNEISVVKKNEKEVKVGAFVDGFLDSLEALEADAETGHARNVIEISVIARSLESPVIGALSKRQSRLHRCGLHIRLVISGIDIELMDPATAGPLLTFANGGVRVAADPRLFDAHEQMTLGDTRMWAGDCLRREPQKRDAFERYATGARGDTAMAAAAFEQIWARSAKMSLADAESATPKIGISGVTNTTNAGLGSEGILASTRH